MKIIKRLAGVTLAGILTGTLPLVAQADDSPSSNPNLEQLLEKIDELEQKVSILERKEELSAEEAEKRKKETPKVTLSDKGVRFESADKTFKIRLRGLLQTDYRGYIDDPSLTAINNDGFLLRRVRPSIEGTVYDKIDYLFVPEYAGSAVSILDANLNFRFFPELNIRIGKFKSPVGLEQLQSDPSRAFLETGLPTLLVPNRDIGVLFHGEAFDGIVSYAAGVLNGSNDGANAGVNDGVDGDPEFAGRLFFHPFTTTDIVPLKGLGFGVGASWGEKENSPAGNGLTAGYNTEGQQRFFSYNPTGRTVTSDGEHWRISPQGYYYYGPLGFQGEYVLSSQQLRSFAGANGVRREMINDAWQVQASYVLTGEDASYKGVTPAKPFDFFSGEAWGAWEVAVRYGNLEVDNDAFSRFSGVNTPFAATGTSAKEASSIGAALNWYLNSNVRASLNYYHTEFKAANGSGFTPESLPSADENVIIGRLQLNF